VEYATTPSVGAMATKKRTAAMMMNNETRDLPPRCQFCRKLAEWVVSGIDELTGDDVRVKTCHEHRGKSGRLGTLVMRYRQSIFGRALNGQ
jgi:hypothetical protein